MSIAVQIIEIKRVTIVVLDIDEKSKFVIIKAASNPANINVTESIFAHKVLTTIHSNKTSKNENITENYVANIFNPLELVVSTTIYALKFPKII